jgi:hypothetical protein
MGQPVLKQLRFQLNLDDPKLPEEKWVTIKGDRAQLEALCEVVTNYVQQFLEQSPNLSNGKSSSAYTGSIAVLPALTEPASALRAVPSNPAEISLQPRGLLSHELALGSLAAEETGATVHLSALQLFDLANALDEYATEVVALPTLQPSRSGWLKSSPAWAQIAAVALVVVGLSTSIAKLWDGSYTAKTAAPTTSQGASSNDQKIATQLPPGATTTEQPSPLTLPNQKLPPAPPVGSTVAPAPGLPNGLKPQVVAPLPSFESPPAGAIASNPTASSRDRAAKTQQEITSSELRRERSQLALKPELSDASPARQSAGAAASRGVDPSASESTAQNNTAFDTIPQVAEVRRYFQQGWTPPQGLDQVLEYRLLIGANGSIQQIIPLGLTAGDYIDRTGIPLVGEPFVSPLNGKRSATVRLVLSPDGKVQTFLERVEQ